MHLGMATWKDEVSWKFSNIITSLEQKYLIIRCLHNCTVTQWTRRVLTLLTIIYKKIMCTLMVKVNDTIKQWV